MAAGAPPEPGCAGCHPGQAAAHAKTNHALALRPAAQTEFARALTERPIGEARGGYLFFYSILNSGLDVIATREGTASGLARAQILFAFGAGDQGVTPVLRLGGKWLEHRISYYPKADRFDLTLGHRPGPSRSGQEALGIEQPAETMRACFDCHATVTTEGKQETIRAGVGCDRCHPGSASHAEAPARAVTNPGKLAAASEVRLCAACHRLTPPGATDDPLNVRFQPLRLAMSRCYQAGQLACSGCHPAHQNARRQDAAFYRERCLACHAQPHRRDQDCAGCHMPKSSPAPYLAFTDHYIRK